MSTPTQVPAAVRMPSTAATAVGALEALRALDGTPTAEQAVALALWTGWGPLAKAFDSSPAPEWALVADRLSELFEHAPADLDAASDCVDTSFYTPAPLSAHMFDLLRAVGFTGGRVLEPGCGSGRFMTAAPADLGISWTGVESDPTAAAIAAALHPHAEIIASPLEKTTLRSDYYDAVIGNVPFSSATVFDAAYETASLHEYFLLRALDAVRVGGYVVVVTSRYAMDTPGSIRRALQSADLVGAVRLPSTTFRSEGTSVVADVLVLRRRAANERLSGWDDTAAHARVRRPGYEASYYDNSSFAWERPSFDIVKPGQDGRQDSHVGVNLYWQANPTHVAGRMTATGFDRAPLTVTSDDATADTARAFADVAAALPPMTQATVLDPAAAFADVVLADAEGRPEGSFHLDDDVILQVTGGKLAVVNRAPSELRALVPLRDAALRLVALESDADLPDHAITPARDEALRLYRAYVSKYGALNRGTLHEGAVDAETGVAALSWRRPSMGGFRRDPAYVTVLAMEAYDPDSGLAEPAPMLLRRVNMRPVAVERVDTAAEAVAVTLGEGGGLDLRRIGSLLGLTDHAATVEALAGHVFRDAAAEDALEPAATFLSGDVRTKLDVARAAALTDHSYTAEVAALEAVMPADLGPTQIRAGLGATWISPADVMAFMSEVLGARNQVTFTPKVAVWEISDSYQRLSPEVLLNWSTAAMDTIALLDHGLNGKPPVVWDKVWDAAGNERKVRNQQATLAAVEKLAALDEKFSTWVWEDAERADRLCTVYNRRFNSHVAAKYDGAHLTFPGLAAGINLWDWQRDAALRIASSERTLIGHAVGAGKTKSAITGVMTLRRFGLARKPMIAVPSHLLEQIAREAQQAYPTARFLIASKEDLVGDARRLFAARCATGDWDAVVVTHQALASFGVDPEFEMAWMQKQKAEYRALLQGNGSGSSRGSKAVARMVRTFETRIAALRDGVADDKQIPFGHLGVDYLAVDEVHLFKRLSIGVTRAEGFSLGASKRATDLLMKVEILADQRPGLPVFSGFTGTPWSNTLAESFVWQKYYQPDRLVEAGVESFDAWAATFVRYETRVEVAPDGSGFRMSTRPSAMKNVPELRGMLDEFADLLPAEAIPLERPEARFYNIAVTPTAGQRAAVAELAKRADKLRSGSKDPLPDGRIDNMLVICGDGRRLALDPQLLGMPDRSPKIGRVADEVARIYHLNKARTFGASATPGALQLAFLDQGTPRPGDTQTYGRLRAELVALDVPVAQIRFVHEAKTDKARAALFASCRDGSVSVLLGSTEKLGIGTNVQSRLVALHHIDGPWRPSDIEQRDGRGLRPGNLNEWVEIYRYVTEETFDAYMWQTLERKARFIAQMFRATITEREIEDIGDTVLSFGEVKALASGNPKLLGQATAAAEVKRLRVLRSMHAQSVNAANRTAADSAKSALTARGLADTMAEAMADLAEQADTGSDVDLTGFGPLGRFAESVRERRSAPHWGRHGVWRGLGLDYAAPGGYRAHRFGASTSESERVRPLPRLIELRVRYGYSDIGMVTLERKVLRRGDAAAAAALHDALTEFVAKLPARRVDVLAESDRHTRQAAAADLAVAGARFEHEDALGEAVTRLASITAAIEAEASQPIAA